MSTIPCKFFQQGRCIRGESCRFAHISQSNDPQVCRFFERGNCLKGDACTFFHDVSKATPATSLEVCTFFRMGKCVKGDNCSYSHDLSREPCFYFHDKTLFDGPVNCEKGLTCPYSHDPITTDQFVDFFNALREKQKASELSDQRSSHASTVDARLEGLRKKSQDMNHPKLESDEKQTDLPKLMESVSLDCKEESLTWQFKEDSGWNNFAVDLQNQLEHQFQQSSNFEYRVQVRNGQMSIVNRYIVDFQKMVQTHLGTNTVKLIRRHNENAAAEDGGAERNGQVAKPEAPSPVSEVEKKKDESEKKREGLLDKIETIEWQWGDMLGQWLSYDQNIQNGFESIYQTDVHATFQFNTTYRFHANFRLMTQTNLQTSMVNHIRRVKSVLPALDQRFYNLLLRWNIATEGSVRRFVAFAHENPQQFKVQVLRILHGFHAWDKNYIPPSTPGQNEMLLFFATTPDTALAVKNGALISPDGSGPLGAGIYLTRSPERFIAWHIQQHGTLFTMLLCLVNLEGCKAGGQGGTIEFYCVDSPKKILPLYILTFG